MDEALIRLQEEELRRTGRYYKHICFLCVPLLCVSCYLYGLRPLLLCGFAVLMGNLCDRLISLLRRRVYQAGDYSNESFALVITLLMPATVDADFCKQVAEIEKGIKDPVMYVGNLSAKRDFTDVRDVVRAYALLVQKGKAGETYNIGTGHALAIQEILERIISLSDKKIEVRVDAQRLRPVDVPIIEPDISKVHDCTGWKPQIPLEQTLRETLEYWRVQDLCQK